MSLDAADVALFSCVYWRRHGTGGTGAAQAMAERCRTLGDVDGAVAWEMVSAQIRAIADGCDCPAGLSCATVCDTARAIASHRDQRAVKPPL